MAWLAGCTSRDRRLVMHAFEEALQNLPMTSPGPEYRKAQDACHEILRGVDPRAGRFIDQARLCAGRIHDVATRMAVDKLPAIEDAAESWQNELSEFIIPESKKQADGAAPGYIVSYNKLADALGNERWS
jgi:hypothetical protein